MRYSGINMSQNFKYTDATPERLDVWLPLQLGINRSQTQKLIKAGRVFVNGKLPKKNGDQIGEGDEIVIAEEATKAEVKAKKVKKTNLFAEIKIIAETPDYLVINKPPGLIVHPEPRVAEEMGVEETDTLAGWLVQNYPEIVGVGEAPSRPGLVHRLDKDTSGLMVIAKTQASFNHLKEQFQARTVEKNYYALVHGKLPVPNGFLNFIIARGKDGRMVARPKIEEVTLRNVASIQDGRAALTEFSVMTEYINYTLIDVKLHTGRTHQIRVHMFAYNHPLVGDPLYFNKKLKRDLDEKLGRVFLHSYHLAFLDQKGERVECESPLPPELKKTLENLKPLV